MPTPPNRRPGVDASIVQATTVRGYDGPQAGDAAQDLLISTGQNQVTLAVADILIWNRTDANLPIFVMRPGADITTAPRFPVFAGAVGDPNGVIISDVGALYVSNNPPALWQNQDGGSTWAAISDELGGEDLAETLVIGNTTGGTNIIVSNGDNILGQSNAAGAGFALSLGGGSATGPAGNGGDVNLAGGTSVAGASGNVQFFTRPASGTNASGNIVGTTGGSVLGGSSGGVSFTTGNTGAAGVGGTPGWITLFGGVANTTGSAQRGGAMRFEAGRAVSDGEGGFVRIVAGDSSNSAVAPIFLAPVAGQGGTVLIQGGSSSLARQGGAVNIRAGAGGSAGAQGGNIFLTPGAGGGGFPAGEVVGNGVIRSTNIQRGTGDPNVLALVGDEGDVYQRTAAGLGQVWLNTNGTPTGWVRLAVAGDFIDSFEQLNWGYIARVGQNPTGNPEDEISDLGILEGVRTNNAAGGAVSAGGSLQAGPYIAFTCTNVGDRAALDMSSGGVSLPTSVEHRFVATFRLRNTVASDQRIFVGLSQLTAASQLASALPGGGAYMGFLLDSSIGGNWRVIMSNGLGITGPLDTGISPFTTNAGTDPYLFVIDATDFSVPVIRFFILDPNFQIVASLSVPTSVPSSNDQMGPVMGISKIAAPAGQKSLQVVYATIVNNADVAGQGGGIGMGALSLSQVLINGNTTGLNPILINQGSSILGVTDDNVGNGASFSVLSGGTTLVGNATGALIVGSANHTVAGATGATGAVAITSGFQFGAGATGNTGTVTLGSGASIGTGGTTGNVILASGVHSGGVGGTVGDVLIAPGTFATNNANPGALELRGGSTSLVGVTSGDVTIRTGQQSAASGDTGDMLIASYDAALAGDSGSVLIATGRAGNLSGASGNLDLRTGNGPAGDTGNATLATGDATAGAAGSVILATGTSTVGAGADIQLTGGDTSAGGQTGGDIVLTPGTGPGGDGEVRVAGKLTVTGLIDPTGLVLDGQAVAPALPAAGQGLLWVDNTVVPSRLFFRDDTGAGHDISNGGGATSLASLTDVTLTAPIAGQVLTYNGVDWVNLAGAGGSPLSTILGIGNTTGNTAGGILVSSGDRIWAVSNLVLDPGAAPGNRVLIDGLRWPDVDGTAGQVLTTDGAGTLSWQNGGGGGGGSQTFAEAFTQMQWGSCVARRFASPFASADGFFDSVSASGGATSATATATGIVASYVTLGVINSDAGFQASSSAITLSSQFLSTFHFDATDPASNMRMFVGVTTGNIASQNASLAPAERYVGIQLQTDGLPAQTTFYFVTDNSTGTPTQIDTGISPSASIGFWLTVDASVPGEVTLTLRDSDYVQLAQHTFTTNLPTSTASLNHVLAIRTLDALLKVVNLWSISSVTRADLLESIGGGGGGNQTLTSVLGFGNSTGGQPIQGDDNAAGAGAALTLLGGSSTGGAGSGGNVAVTSGSPDPAGNGSAGDILLTTPNGVGTGRGGDMTLDLGNGGPTNGDGGAFSLATGNGVAGGGGGDVSVTLGNGGAAGGQGGIWQVTAGSATGANGIGGNVVFTSGDGFGTGDGGFANLTAGDGGAGGGDGGDVNITVGSGAGGGTDGEIFLNGDTTITGKLTVTGLIDPTGLLLNDQGAVPFTPVGNDGGIWVNNSGELVYTNALGDLNISTAIGGGMTWLEAINLVGYGFLGPGNSTSAPQSYGVYGSSVDSFVSPGPPPAAITFGTDVDGPFLNAATAAAANSEAWISTNDALIRRDQLFRAVFKFQITSPSNNNERIFVGFTDDPTTQLSVDDPPGNEFFGLVEINAPAPAHNLQFVARGSGGAMTPIIAIPTDTAVHYLVIDAISTTEVVFTLLAADGQTVQATHTEPASLLMPALTTALFPFTGIRSDAGATPRGIDFYFSSVVTRADIVNAVAGGGGGGGGGGIPLLSAVLTAGNSTGASDILISRTAPTGIVTESASVNTATAGKSMTFGIGTGSTETGTGSAGGAGGSFTAIAGAGGATDAIAAAGGAGGLARLGGGAGGSNSGGGAPGGAGGALQLTTGAGGAGTAGSTGGAAGTLSITAGNGGTSTGGLGGTGGTVTLTAGNGGAGTIGPGTGGNIVVSAGTSSANTGGAITLTSGAGSVAGAVNITAANSISGIGAGITLTAGNSAGGGGGAGGRVRNVTGNGANNGNGGAFEVVTGTGNGTGNGGSISILTGAGGASSGDGGNFNMALGGGAGGGNGGSLVVASGAGQGAGLGGNVQLVAGAGGATNATGGQVQLVGGNGGGNGDGGNVDLVAGTSPGTGTQGSVILRTNGTIDTRGLRFHTFEQITAAGAGLVVLTNAYTLTANQTAVHIQGQVTGQGMTTGNAVCYAVFDGVWYRSGGAVAGAGFHGTVTLVGGASTDAPVWTVLVDALGNNIRINVRGSAVAGTNQNVRWIAQWSTQQT